MFRKAVATAHTTRSLSIRSSSTRIGSPFSLRTAARIYTDHCKDTWESMKKKVRNASKIARHLRLQSKGVTEACGCKLKREEIIAFMMPGKYLIWKSTLIFHGGREINWWIDLNPSTPGYVLQPKPLENLLCISICYTTSNVCSLLKQQHLYYKIYTTKKVQDVWEFHCCDHKN